MRKTIYSILGILMTFVAFQQAGCLDLPEDLIMPNWDVELNVPLVDTTFTLEEILKSDRQEYIGLNPVDNIYYIESEDYEISSGISEFITVSNERATTDQLVTASTPSRDIYLAFPDGAQLDEATFTQGTLRFVARRTTSTGTPNLTLKVPGIKDPSGNQLQLILSPSNNYSVSKDLSGYSYKEPAEQGFLFPGLIWFVVQSNLAANDSVYIDSYSSDFLFSSAKGYLPRKSLGVTNSSYALNLGDAVDFRDKAYLKEANLGLTANYKSSVSDPFEIEVKDLKVIGKRNNGQKLTLSFNNSNALTLRFMQGRFDTMFTAQNSNVEEFLTFLPDSVIVSAEYIMNPDNDSRHHTVTNKDSVSFKTSFNTKSIFALRKSTIVDTADVELSDDDRDKIRDGRAANLTLEVNNGIPLTSWLKVDMVDANYNLLYTITKNEGKDSVYFIGAEVNSSGEVTNSSVSTTKLQLDSTQIHKLADARYLIYHVSVRTKNGDLASPPTVALRGNQKITIKAYGTVKYFVKPEED